MEEGITLHPEYGVNPSVVHCAACGKDYGVAFLGRNQGREAPRRMVSGFCGSCDGALKAGAVLLVEVDPKLTTDKADPYRTGWVVGIRREAAEKILGPIAGPMAFIEAGILEQLGLRREDADRG